MDEVKISKKERHFMGKKENELETETTEQKKEDCV